MKWMQWMQGVQTSRDHRKLRAFELADNVVLAVYRATRGFTKEELFGLTSQMRRSAVSVAANIVEGAGREGDREFAHFLSQSFASLREVGYYISLASKLGCLSPAASKELVALHAEASRVLAALLRTARARVGK